MKTAKETVEHFLKSLDDFIHQTNTNFAHFREEFLIVSDLSDEQLRKLTKEELFDSSYMLYSYASYIQDQINKQKVVYDLCTDQLEKLVAQHSEEFSKYTKHEAKIQLVINENEYAKSIDNYRSIAHARLQSLDGKVYELKRKADILLEKGKRS